MASTVDVPIIMSDDLMPNPFGDIIIANSNENNLYIDNFYCSLDTDYDGVIDLDEVWGKATVNDVNVFSDSAFAVYRFFIHRIDRNAVEPFNLVLRMKFPNFIDTAGWSRVKLKIHKKIGDAAWDYDTTGQTIYGKGYWQTYVMNTIHTFPADGDPSGKEVQVCIEFDPIGYPHSVEVDWLGLRHFNEEVQLDSADICDADDFQQEYSAVLERKVIHQRYEWEYYDFDGDQRAERLESRISMRTSIPYGLYRDDFYDTGVKITDNPDAADTIFYGGRQYKY